MITEIRWHARAGQGAKTASQLLALALMRTGKSVQAFPEYGPERRGAPMRAYTRVADRPIRRHDAVEHPDIAVVLEPSLVHEHDVAEGLSPDGIVLVAGDTVPLELAGLDARAVPTNGNVNVTMAAAVGALLGAPQERIADAATELLGRKVAPAALHGAVEEGYRWLS